MPEKESSGVLYTLKIFIVKHTSWILSNGVLHHITPMAKVLMIWSHDNGLHPCRPPAHFPAGLSWTLKAHLPRTEVPKPQLRELPSYLALTTLHQALISLRTPFSACLVLMEEPAGFNVCICLVKRHQFGLMQSLCCHTSLRTIFKEEKVCQANGETKRFLEANCKDFRRFSICNSSC